MIIISLQDGKFSYLRNRIPTITSYDTENSDSHLNCSGFERYIKSDYAGALEDFNAWLDLYTDDIIVLNNRGLSKILLGDYKGALQDFDRSLILFPDDPITLSDRGFVKYILNDFAGALQDMDMSSKAFLKLDITDALLLNNRALVKHELYDDIGALEDLTECIGLSPNNELFINNRAIFQEFSGNLDKALKDFDAAINLKNNGNQFCKILKSRGLLKRKLYDYEGASKDFNLILIFNDHDSDVLREKGEILRFLGSNEAALECFDLCLKINSKDVLALNYRGIIKSDLESLQEEAMQDFNQAISILDRLEVSDIEKIVDVLCNRASLKRKRGDCQGAIEDCDEALSKKTDCGDALYYKALSEMDLGRMCNALKYFNDALPICSNNPNYWRDRGMLHQELEEHEKALSDFNTCLEINPQDASALNSRGLTKIDLNNPADALDDFNQSLSFLIGNSGVLSNRALAKWEIGDYLGALDDYNAAIMLGSEDATVLYNRGRLKSTMSDDKGALEDFNTCLEYDPDDIQALINRALTHEKLKNFQEALVDFEAALSQEPTHKDRNQWTAAVRRIRSKISNQSTDLLSVNFDKEISRDIKNEGLLLAQDSPTEMTADDQDQILSGIQARNLMLVKEKFLSIKNFMSDDGFIEEDGAVILGQAMKDNETLTEMNIVQDDISGKGVVSFAEALTKNKTLKKLVFYESFNANADAIRIFSAAIAVNTALEILEIVDSSVVVIKEFWDALEKNITLKKLDFSGCTVYFGNTSLASTLGANKALIKLDLRNTGLGVNGAVLLATGLSKNQTLEDLDVACNDIGDDGVGALSDVLQINNTLSAIDISYNNISSRGAQFLSLAFKNSQLKRLNLANNNIQNEGAQFIFNALSSNTSLEEISVRENNISDGGMEAISQSSISLTTLDCSQNIVKTLSPMWAIFIKNSLRLANLKINAGVIHDATAESIAKELTMNLSLKTIHISIDEISCNSLSFFKNALQRNHIITSFFVHHTANNSAIDSFVNRNKWESKNNV